VWTNPGEITANGVDDDGNGLIDDVRGWDFYWDSDPPMATATAPTSRAPSPRKATTASA
jgi:hypothetical protein